MLVGILVPVASQSVVAVGEVAAASSVRNSGRDMFTKTLAAMRHGPSKQALPASCHCETPPNQSHEGKGTGL